MENLLTAKEAAALLNVHQETVWRWMRSGKLETIYLGPKSKRIRKEALEAFVRERRVTS